MKPNSPTLIQNKTLSMARAWLREDFEEAWMQPGTRKRYEIKGGQDMCH